ncbi:hypothetical protein ABT174_20930 [Streptomyces sparsogenes]|uniref:hypothetical protein n=1 Tax=Streptomyces sparsogenes TaxID=67365 RepID=UPI0033309703
MWIPAYGRVLLGRDEGAEADDEVKLPADTTMWWTMAWTRPKPSGVFRLTAM